MGREGISYVCGLLAAIHLKPERGRRSEFEVPQARHWYGQSRSQLRRFWVVPVFCRAQHPGLMGGKDVAQQPASQTV